MGSLPLEDRVTGMKAYTERCVVMGASVQGSSLSTLTPLYMLCKIVYKESVRLKVD